jgi:hypothetical protein
LNAQLGGWWMNMENVMNNDSNNGFWDRPADARAERMRDAAERGGVDNFFDLPPEDRARAYEDNRDE